LGGTPDRILEVPYVMSEYAPSTFTTGLYVGIIGDFSFYWIADSLKLEIQRLDELYAVTNQVGFIGRSETDGLPVLAEAFARVKLG
jgi:HK97 family phage major capsid protein